MANELITPEEFAHAAVEAMNKVEDEAGIPRGTVFMAWLDEFNARLPESTAE